MPVAVEYTTLTITATYTTSWGTTASSVNTTIKPGVTTPPIVNGNTSYAFPAGTAVSLTAKQLLALAGVALTDTNQLTDGGAGPPWPRFRVTGVEVLLDLAFFNYVETLLPPDPFNFNNYLIITAQLASNGTFRGSGSQLWYTGAAPTPETGFMVRTSQGVLLTFTSSDSSIGHATVTALAHTLLGAFLLMGAATGAIDTVANFAVEGFRAQKFEDDLDLKARARACSFRACAARAPSPLLRQTTRGR